MEICGHVTICSPFLKITYYPNSVLINISSGHILMKRDYKRPLSMPPSILLIHKYEFPVITTSYSNVPTKPNLIVAPMSGHSIEDINR